MSIRELDYEQSLLYNEVRSATDIASKKSSSVANNSRQFFLNSSHLISTGPTCQHTMQADLVFLKHI